MDIKAYAIGGNFNHNTATGDAFIGTITDNTTAMSLFDLVESKGGYAVSLHGNGISGEFILKDARKLFQPVIN